MVGAEALSGARVNKEEDEKEREQEMQSSWV
jgi:hypothetical protein